jgi:hypothetical protein
MRIFSSLMITDAQLSQVEGGQNIEESEQTRILMEEKKNAMKSRKDGNYGIDAVMK